MGNLFSINSPLWNFCNKVLHLLWLSLLWFVCCIPVITMGASTTALYSVMLKYVKNEEGYLTRSFFISLKQNFRQAVIIWICLFFPGLFLGVNLLVYTRSTDTGLLPMILTTVFFSVILVFVLINIYVYAVLAKFDNTVARTVINSAIMAIRHWPFSIGMLAIALIVPVIGCLYFPPLLFVAPAGIAYVNSRFFTRIFELYLPADQK